MSAPGALQALRPAGLVVGALIVVAVAEPLAEAVLGLAGGAGLRLHAVVVLLARGVAGYLLGVASGSGRARLSRARQLGMFVPAAAVAVWPLLVPVLVRVGVAPAGFAGLVPAQLPPFAAVVMGLALGLGRR